jgi:hypothetical protein
MQTPLPNDTQKQKIKKQWNDLLDHAASSLTVQFPFLDLNLVRQAKEDSLNRCYGCIDIPLQPGFSVLFTEDQVHVITQRWHALGDDRVNAMIGLGGEAVMLDKKNYVLSEEHPHYLLASRCMDQFCDHIQKMTNRPPEYYQELLTRRMITERHGYQDKVNARKLESYLYKTTFKQMLLIEQWSFLMTSLLESCLSTQDVSVENEPNSLP